MVRVLSLLWTFVLAVLITAVSFFYTRGDLVRGFPFSFVSETVTANAEISYSFNYWLLFFDLFIWWVLFSILWIIIKNYVLELD